MAPGPNVIKNFGIIYFPSSVNLSQHLRQYADSGINYAKKVL